MMLMMYTFFSQLSLTMYMQVQILSNAGGGLFQGTHGWLCLHVSLWWTSDDYIWHFCESGVPGPGLHHHAGVRVESTEPECSHELLWPAQLSGTLPALGANGILTSAGQLYHRGSFRYCCWSCVLLPGGCFPKSTRWWKVAQDPINHKDALWHSRRRCQL